MNLSVGLTSGLFQNYDTIQAEKRALNVDSWFLMSSPLPVASVLAAYLLFVLKLGPAFMRDRKPLQLTYLLVVYNFCQSVESGALQSFYRNVFQPNNPSRIPLSPTLASASWWYFFSKLVELLDTVFFVLRKNQRQVTFLHVYHHTITAGGSWCFLKYLPGEQGLIVGLFNCAVHVFMYFYYMLAALGPSFHKYLWWKPYITILQMAQFIMVMIYTSSIIIFNDKLPTILSYFFLANAAFFAYLFSDFYKKTYNPNKKYSSVRGTLKLN
ncbi:very long chain fatty acid elongase 7-like isoform X2 [Bacillus rossius redtenbacheri]|uniref:very long chain fatty acid elongase 7-like isoform X2 n=1 Tax=Bacillus rossius redtenbacheri TaxID=93214 RepID=UPI002FDCCAEE